MQALQTYAYTILQITERLLYRIDKTVFTE